MKLDLIVTAFGDSPHLRACLSSLADQWPVRAQYARLTVATSTPSEFVRTEARRVGARYVVNPIRRSIGTDWNFALSVSEAHLVALCHQDDIYAPTFAVRMLELFGEYPGLLMASSSYTQINGDGREGVSIVQLVKRLLMYRAFQGRQVVQGPAMRRRMFSWGNPVCCSSVVINARQLVDFRFDDSLLSNLDWDAWDRIASLPGDVGYLDQPLVKHRVHSCSATSGLIQDNARPIEDLRMLTRYWPPALARAWLLVYSQAYRSHRGTSSHKPDSIPVTSATAASNSGASATQ